MTESELEWAANILPGDYTMAEPSWVYEQNTARGTVAAYIKTDERYCIKPSDNTLRCFVGMLETGEIKPADLAHVGGQGLLDQVRAFATEIGVVV